MLIFFAIPVACYLLFSEAKPCYQKTRWSKYSRSYHCNANPLVPPMFFLHTFWLPSHPRILRRLSGGIFPTFPKVFWELQKVKRHRQPVISRVIIFVECSQLSNSHFKKMLFSSSRGTPCDKNNTQCGINPLTHPVRAFNPAMTCREISCNSSLMSPFFHPLKPVFCPFHWQQNIRLNVGTTISTEVSESSSGSGIKTFLDNWGRWWDMGRIGTEVFDSLHSIVIRLRFRQKHLQVPQSLWEFWVPWYLFVLPSCIIANIQKILCFIYISMKAL